MTESKYKKHFEYAGSAPAFLQNEILVNLLLEKEESNRLKRLEIKSHINMMTQICKVVLQVNGGDLSSISGVKKFFDELENSVQ